MEEKKTIKLSLQTVFLIIAIIIIIIMGMVIYKLNNDKTIETKRANELQSKTNELKNAVDDLNKTVSNNSNNSFTSNNNKDLVNNKIIGKWKASKVVDRHGNDMGLNSVWGSGIKESNEMQFKENGILQYRIGITASSDDGVYYIKGNTVNYEIPTDIKGKMRKGTFIYIPEEDVLKEDINEDSEEKVTITYVRTDEITATINNTTSQSIAEEKIIKTAHPWGFSGSSLLQVRLYANGNAYCIIYNGEGYSEKDIAIKKLIAKNVEDIESDEETGSVILRGKSLEEIENMGWTKFQK